MKPGVDDTLAHLLDIRSMLLGFAIFNFTTIWMMDAQIFCTCAACPWYHPWSYFNEPTILLVASIFLNAKRWWGDIVALLLTIYLIVYFVYLISHFADPFTGFIYDLRRLRVYYPYIVTSWQSQYLMAVIVSWCAVLSLKTNLRSRRVSHASKNLRADGWIGQESEFSHNRHKAQLR